MKRQLAYFLLITVFVTSCNKSIYRKQHALLKLKSWKKEVINNSITHYEKKFKALFGNKQNINLLDIDLGAKEIQFAIAYKNGELVKTSDFAKTLGGIVAINGSFFHPKEGGAVCFFKKSGKIVNLSRNDLDDNYYINELDSAAVTINASGMISITSCPSKGWSSLDSVPTILTTGPALILNGKILTHKKHSFNDSKFSRTGLGITKQHHLMMVVADGNSVQSAGLTIDEFAQVFHLLGCYNAINLDGGGSSTMYINGLPNNGIVNHPTDHKYYNYLSERKVADAIVVFYHARK